MFRTKKKKDSPCFNFLGDEELCKFLKEEISAEKKTQKAASLPTNVGSFKVSTDGATVKLTRDFQGES